jgi:hypothetical protein
MRSNKSRSLLTLKQTNKLNGIVKNTRTHDRKIRIFPHVDASLVSLSSVCVEEKERDGRLRGERKSEKII